MLAKYKAHIIATLAVVVVMFIFAFIGALLDFKNAGGLVVQVPMFFLVVAVWGYVYNAFKPKEGQPSKSPPADEVAAGPQAAGDTEIRKYLHLSGLTNLVLGVLLLSALLKIMAMQENIRKMKPIPAQYTFMYMGEKRFTTVERVERAMAAGGVLLGQSTVGEQEDYDKARKR